MLEVSSPSFSLFYLPDSFPGLFWSFPFLAPPVCSFCPEPPLAFLHLVPPSLQLQGLRMAHCLGSVLILLHSHRDKAAKLGKVLFLNDSSHNCTIRIHCYGLSAFGALSASSSAKTKHSQNSNIYLLVFLFMHHWAPVQVWVHSLAVSSGSSGDLLYLCFYKGYRLTLTTTKKQIKRKLRLWANWWAERAQQGGLPETWTKPSKMYTCSLFTAYTWFCAHFVSPKLNVRFVCILQTWRFLKESINKDP